MIYERRGMPSGKCVFNTEWLLDDNNKLELMERAEKEQKIVYVTKANSFKRTTKDVEADAEQLSEKIEILQKKLKH